MAATAEVFAAVRAGVSPRVGSITRTRRKALIWSYVFLIIFVIFFLTPPLLHCLITSLKSRRGNRRRYQSLVRLFTPSFDNYTAPCCRSSNFLVFFRNSAVVSLSVVAINDADQRAGRLRARARI